MLHKINNKYIIFIKCYIQFKTYTEKKGKKENKMKKSFEDKKVENILRAYYEDQLNVQAYQSKLNYYDQYKSIINENINYQKEVESIKRKIAEINFKNKYLEQIIKNLTDDEQKYIECKYRRKLSVIEIQDEMFIKERTYYRIRKTVINHLKSLLVIEKQI